MLAAQISIVMAELTTVSAFDIRLGKKYPVTLLLLLFVCLFVVVLFLLQLFTLFLVSHYHILAKTTNTEKKNRSTLVPFF